MSCWLRTFKVLVRVGMTITPALCAGVLGAGCKSFPACRPIEAAPGILAGSKPRTQADFERLKEHGVRTILSLETLPWHIAPERRKALKNGIAYVNVPIWASPLEPKDWSVKQALLLLRQRSLQPIFVHCFLGEDRNIFIIGLYRVYYQDWPAEAAWAEMLRSRFHTRKTLRGFTTYFWSHTEKPDWVRHSETAAKE